MRVPRYDVLFEQVPIGPVTARHRFYQVPHCNGMGHRHPQALAEMRGIKAEGGWAVVCTEETEIHPSSDLSPYIELRNWDDTDIASLALIPENREWGVDRVNLFFFIEKKFTLVYLSCQCKKRKYHRRFPTPYSPFPSSIQLPGFSLHT